jgi:starch phosphorylase
MYYLSLEFLVGRLLRNAACNLGIESTLTEALGELGYVLEDIYEEERDPALGNGGLGRLAGKQIHKTTLDIGYNILGQLASWTPSPALTYPRGDMVCTTRQCARRIPPRIIQCNRLWLRYGMFKQLIRAGEQKEVPDKWLDEGNPWEITRLARSSAPRAQHRTAHLPQARRRVSRALLRQR